MATPLSRQISLNVTKQQDQDCFAHAVSRVLVKAYRKLYPNELSFKRPEVSLSEDPNQRCVFLYNIPNAFYKCEETTKECHPVSMKTIEKKCTDTETLNLLLYMHFWSMLVKRFSCNGSFTNIAMYFCTHPFMTDPIEGNCNLHLTMCNKLQSFFKMVKSKNYPPQVLIPYSFKYSFNVSSIYKFVTITNDNVHGIDIEHSGVSVCNPVLQQIFLFKKTDHYKEQVVNYAPGKYPNPSKLFFEKIEYILKKSLYVVLSGAGSFFEWKSEHKKLYTGQDVVLPHDGHSVTIVGYDYSNPSNKMLHVKNSWGIGQQGHQYTRVDDKFMVTTMQIYESEMIAFSNKYDNTNEFEIDYVDCLPLTAESKELRRKVFTTHPSEIFVVPSDEVDPHIPSRLPYKMDTPENSKIRKNIKVEKNAQIEKERIRLRDRELHSSEYTDEYLKSLSGMFEGQHVTDDDSSSSWFSIPKFRAGTRKQRKQKKKTKNKRVF